MLAMNEYVKALAPRFAIILFLILFVVPSISFFGTQAIIVLFVCLILLALIIDYATNGVLTLWIFSKIKELGWYKVEPDLELVTGEKIIYPLSPAYIRMFGAGYSFRSRDIIITNKRVAMGLDVLGVKEAFGEMNLWQPSMTIVPKVKRKIGIPCFLGDVKAKEAKLNKSGKAALITVNQLGMDILIEIFHPKAKEICTILSE